ncbi:adenylate/guanylate cyclase domain-containing protein [Croceibacterium sp. LX-88]|uniref:Adenylate/guanylate cyclase domain-containing protein n=1 Tax=Croceibacterium selenioxidans TaxID=2838833 RepID=A0ABS5W5J5_9SPHN|nr:adenylate/guanylate cyclase domain-containing protein [Croceibacterium selenioxidans]MBT2135011.1 adenylate/guanylate cyclase domain-containing protein [Croceibacterium selenioxidans]
MAGDRSSNFVARGWHNVREAGTRRLVLTALLLIVALLLARFSWYLPVTDQAENRLYDLRSFVLAEQVGQDDRIALVVYDDQTLINARKRSPLDRGLLAQALRNLDAMGAKAIGIDILFDQPQDEDDELIDTLRAMKTPVSVAFAETSVNEGDIKYEQQQYLEQFLARLEGSKAHPASIALSNADGVTRVWPKLSPQLPPTLGRNILSAAGESARTFPGYEGSIRYRRPASDEIPIYSPLQIDSLVNPDVLPYLRPAIEGRYVLIGGDIVDYDRVATSLTAATGETPPGMQVHAEMIAQMLDGARLSKPAPVVLWFLGVVVVLTAALTGLVELRSLRIYPLLAIQFAALLGVPFLLQWRGIDTYGLPAAGWLLGWIVAFSAVTSAARASSAVQRRFAQGALGKYLPREMAEEILEHPERLSLHGEKKDIYVLFSDLEGFTKMSHALQPEMVAKLLNRYLDMLSDVVLEHGGVIDKFVGDAVVAFWGAPIARPDDGARAARAGYAVWQAGEAFRKSIDPSLPPVGKTRVGLHFGEAVIGNFGGKSRIQYTALGDSMNTASRLEAANKALYSSVMASREFADRSGLDWWRPMGRVVLRGRMKPVDLFEPAPDFPQEDRAALHQAMILVEKDRPAALEVLRRIAEKHPDDAALANLVERTERLSNNYAFALG